MLQGHDPVTRQFTVLPASLGHGDVVGEIHAESWKAAYANLFSPEFFAEAVGRRRNKWHKVLTDTKQTVMLAQLDGRPLAFSYFGSSQERRQAAEIFGFYGHPDGWGSGVASALMTASLQRIHNEGVRSIHLWTLRDTPQSRRFYAKNGFTESGAVRSHDFGDGRPIEQIEYELILH